LPTSSLFPESCAASAQLAAVTALLNSVFEELQIALILAPELMKSAAEASATNAINKVYSIKS
jgi:hypothetical protein